MSLWLPGPVCWLLERPLKCPREALVNPLEPCGEKLTQGTVQCRLREVGTGHTCDPRLPEAEMG